ncbi:uncharacterized protein O9250_008010 isoform 2-T21 [Rhynochetos jubatus]
MCLLSLLPSATPVSGVVIPQHILTGGLMLLPYKPAVSKAGGSRGGPKLQSLPAIRRLLSHCSEAPELPVLLLHAAEGCTGSGEKLEQLLASERGVCVRANSAGSTSRTHASSLDCLSSHEHLL